MRNDFKASIIEWTEKHMEDHASNIAIPVVRFGGKGMSRDIVYSVMIGDPDDAERISNAFTAKDPGTWPPGTPYAVANEPTVEKWRPLRSQLVDAFLPKTRLGPLVPKLVRGSREMLDRWSQIRKFEAGAELHHYTMKMFLSCMMNRPGQMPATPEESNEVRYAFNIEGLLGVSELMRTQPTRTDFANLALDTPGQDGPALEILRGIDDETSRLYNTMTFIVAGHDTTAHTLEWMLLELARHPEVQERCRQEAEEILGGLEAAGRELEYEDLERLEVTNAIIMETLRLWGPAWFVFPRVLPREETIKGREGPVTIPKGTLVNFWIYGHHHSRSLWGEDADEFRPLARKFADGELQRGTKRTPYSQRFQPFSYRPRDCIGKNFSLLEMRVLLLHMLRRFRLELAEDNPQYRTVRGSGQVFKSWLSRLGTIKPPNGLWLSVVDAQPASRL